jgi:hypothetical protein
MYAILNFHCQHCQDMQDLHDMQHRGLARFQTRTTAGLEECVFQAAFLSSTQCAPPPLLPRPRLRAPFGALTKPMSASMAANCCRMSASISSVCVLSMCLRANDPAVCRSPYVCINSALLTRKISTNFKKLLIANAGATV